MTTRFETFILCVIAPVLFFTMPGCEKKGPVEKAGEKVDDAVEKAGEAVEDAGDEVKEATDSK